MSLIRVTGSQLHAARVLVGLSREDLAERAGAVPALNPQVGDVERRRPGGNLFASVPRGRCTRERGRAVQRRWGQLIIRRLTRLSNGSGTPLNQLER
jgi:hypothetical protein